ncbi:MAG: glycoside hydrolase/phage tail family protein [Rhizobiaceae bacterium]|nr:glycoside hydrolase/phage tail family protein [Rhizobiaceae bacterium]
MATIVLQAAGAFLGGLLGTTGAAIGTAAAAIAGYVIDRAILEGSRHHEGPRLTGPRPFSAEDGASLPRVYGSVRVGGTLIWATRFEEERTTSRQGAKGRTSTTTEYSYFANVAFALAEGRVASIRRVWADGRELDREQVEMRFYRGTEGHAADPLIEAKQGEGNTPAYRGTCYVVFERFPLGDYGNRIPQFHFEVIRPVSTAAAGLKAVALIPGATEFGLSPHAVTREIQPGETEVLNRHVLTAESDIAASLDELRALCPALEHVGLVVSWFGDDLRAGECKVRPAVIDNGVAGFSEAWKVSGLTRATAPMVSYHAGGAAYGGTPSDQSVIDAIAAIKARGLKVTLYPFVMMDIPAGNGLPDPYGAGTQPRYPWRGRITCDPAPMQPGSADKTSAARTQVDAFCGDAGVGDFAPAVGTIAFSGDADDWGYRRLVLHYAHLAEQAGGVDAFLIGSELRGLTALRDNTGDFPFVEALCDIAADVRSILRPATKITYGADWSEYFGHQPADGTGDVFFHLDALWAHPAIDAVGIDNYMPLADWQDADFGGGNPDGFAGPYDPAGMRAAIRSGEGFDWFYASSADRRNRVRTPIADGAHGKPWVFRFKDLWSWWANQHVNRPGGTEAGGPTAWVPRSKPIWLTEVGCPAVDKGPNQPNVFPDPKSAESETPHFSTGARADLAPLRFVEAHLAQWTPGGSGFVTADNPVSPAYGGRMVDPDRLYAWSWDARPFPAFPQFGDLWSDGGNWLTGHWLNGRLAGVAIGDLINAILADHGLPPADVSRADSFAHGYVVPDPVSARTAIDSIVDLFGLNVREVGGTLVFGREGAGAPTVSLGDIAMEDGRATMELTRTPEADLPSEAILAFRDLFSTYQSATARQAALAIGPLRQETISFPGVLEPSQAESLLGDWLKRRWMQRERVAFAVAPTETAVEPGAIVRLPGTDADFLVDEVEAGLVKRVSARQVLRAPSDGGAPVLPVAVTPEPVEHGKPLVHFLDLPMGLGSGGAQEQFRVAAWAKPWKTQAVFASPETTGFVRRATIERPAFCGTLTAPLAPGGCGRVDEDGALTVQLAFGELASVSRLQMLNGANAAAVRSDSGVWEVLQFETGEETAPSVWTLSGLLRGQLGTDDAAAAGAAAGAPFVLLDQAVKPAGLGTSEAGLTLNWKIGPAGYDFATAKFAEATVAGGIRARQPLSPAHLKADWDGADLRVTWVRRGRIGADSWEGADIPLGEESERYRIEVSEAGGDVVRTVEVTEPAWVYEGTDMTADFPVRPVEVEIVVRQVGSAGAGSRAGILVDLT